MSANWKLDAAHSSISFTVRHMVFAKVHGGFNAWETELDHVASDLSDGHIKVTIDASSIDTGVEDRDGHLRSADFFDVETYPNIVFESTSVDWKNPEKLLLTGNLTIRGTTNEITLDVDMVGRGKDPWGNERVGFSGSTTINRKDFGLTWNQVLEAGGVLVGEKVSINVDAQFMRAAQ